LQFLNVKHTLRLLDIEGLQDIREKRNEILFHYKKYNLDAFRPEHTLASYELAIDQGVDIVETDIVATKDGYLVARHANGPLEDVTDVDNYPEFASRRTTKQIGRLSYSGFFTEDFTLAELRTLRVKEYFEFRWQHFNHLYQIPTLQEFLLLVRAKEIEKRKTIGVYIETKEPAYFRSIGLPLEERLVQILNEFGYNSSKQNIFIESFETENLVKLNKMTDIRLVQLIEVQGRIQADTGRDFAELILPEGLSSIARYADGIGPAKSLVLPLNSSVPTTLIYEAHARGLIVHAFTFRSEPQFVHSQFKNVDEEYYYWFDVLEVDGVFTDHPDRALAVRQKLFNPNPSLMLDILDSPQNIFPGMALGLLAAMIVACSVIFGGMRK